MGKVLSGILGTHNDYQANTGGQDFNQAIANAQGNINNNLQGQQSLAQALQAQASGAGPNPAQAMLHQATDNSIKQNSSMLASQKGINPGSTQRLVALNAANQGQQEAGQGALMQAQQQVAANGQLGSLYGQIGQQGQSNLNGYQSALNQNNAINSGVAASNQAADNAITGAVASGLGGIAGKTATGGIASDSSGNNVLGGGNSSSTSQFGGLGGNYKFAHGGPVPGSAPLPGDSPKNDVVPAMLSPGEAVIPRSAMSDPAKAKAFIDEMMKNKSGKPESKGFGEIAQIKQLLKQLEAKGAK